MSERKRYSSFQWSSRKPRFEATDLPRCGHGFLAVVDRAALTMIRFSHLSMPTVGREVHHEVSRTDPSPNARRTMGGPGGCREHAVSRHRPCLQAACWRVVPTQENRRSYEQAAAKLPMLPRHCLRDCSDDPIHERLRISRHLGTNRLHWRGLWPAATHAPLRRRKASGPGALIGPGSRPPATLSKPKKKKAAAGLVSDGSLRITLAGGSLPRLI
jgi:hypothetical protein